MRIEPDVIDADNDAVVTEIILSNARPTGSGMWRTDEAEFGDALDAVVWQMEQYLGVVRQDAWVMEHTPGSEEVISHHHNNWKTAIYYPISHPSALLLAGYSHTPEAGDLVLLDAGEKHGVEANDTFASRFSVVMTYA